MKSFFNYFGLFCAILFICAACKTQPQSAFQDRTVLALVNGNAITEDDLYMRLHNRYEGSSAEVREQAIEDLIQEELLCQQGMKLGLDKDAKFRNAVRIMEMKLRAFRRAEMARRVASTKITATVNVTEKDVQEYYSRNQAIIAKELHLYVIEFPNEKKAQEALEKIQSGASFEEVARERDPAGMLQKQKPWDTGFLRWHQIPKEWTNYINAMKKGNLRLVASNAGPAAIIKLVDIRKNAEATYDGMSASIMTRLREERVGEAYERYIQDLRSSSRIEKNNERRIAS